MYIYLCVLQQYDSLKKKGDDLYRARKYREAVDEYSSAIICWYAHCESTDLLEINPLSLLPVTCNARAQLFMQEFKCFSSVFTAISEGFY